ncbi:unnamed protein product [Caenorhabditis auriculariae]|uniref:G-protein coupled receptors family 1 profile domain-containing protein n=1 Tax=Caenorhabditis auriculariae TaxID=2777116 RepID=A0A8S1HCT0_9PELO|nr:unnamed protein product [Caenorhabditis auriculariae]
MVFQRYRHPQTLADRLLDRGMNRTEVDRLVELCRSPECIALLEQLMSGQPRNCSYRYSSPDTITSIALWIDGPITGIAVLLSLLGARFAVRFLWRAGLNKELTAALFILCAIDSLLMITVFFFYCIEAIGTLTTGSNIMYKHQAFTTSLHGVASSLTTSSTMLVIYITFLRFMVVMRPMRYASNYARSRMRTSCKGYRKCSSLHDESIVNNSSAPSRNAFSTSSVKRKFSFRKLIRPFLFPALLVLLCFMVNIPVYFEFTVEKCHNVEFDVDASHPFPTTFRNTFSRYKAVLMTLTQSIGPVATILILSLMTEYQVHVSLKARRKLFESQQRSRAVVLSEELKERVSRTVAIFIAVKFLILRSMPVFFDIYENVYGIDQFGVALSVMVRVSDFMIVLNSATNSLAYFGKKEAKASINVSGRLSQAGLTTEKEDKEKEKRFSVVQISPKGSYMANSGFKNGMGHPLHAETTPLVATISTTSSYD